MPLSKPTLRKLLHTRQIQCCGYQRDDGLWEVEAHMADTKTYGFPNLYRGEVQAGEPVHDMWLRVVFDDRMRIVEVEAKTDAGPFRICPEINVAFKALEGLVMGPGWKQLVRARVGGVKGCTHLVELLDPLATTAFQTFYGAKSKAIREGKFATSEKEQRPFLLNSCHAYAEDGEVVKELYPKFHKKPGTEIFSK